MTYLLLNIHDIIVFLAFLEKQKSRLEDVARSHLVVLPYLLFVERDGVLLELATYLAFGGEHCGFGSAEVDGADALIEKAAADGELRDTVEHRKQGCAVEGVELLGGAFAEEEFGGCDGGLVVLDAVDAAGDILRESLLEHTTFGRLSMFGFEGFYLFLREESEDTDIASGVDIGAVEPELVELVGRSLLGVEPDVAALGLAELGAVGLSDEGAGECVSLATFHTTDKLGAGCNVAPLVGTSHLEAAVLGAVQSEVVEPLKELIGELCEGDARLHAFLHRVFSHHIVDGNMLTYITNKVEEKVIFHPVVVVEYLCSVYGVIEVKEFLKLLLYAVNIMLYLLWSEKLTFCSFE